MKDWLAPSVELGNEDNIYVLCPAQEGRECGEAPFMKGFGMGHGPCVLLTGDGKCSVHDHKPTQCRMTFCCDKSQDDNRHGNGYSNFDIAELWDTSKGRALVKRWEKIVRHYG
jgi:Fe-S-cluster containining protein